MLHDHRAAETGAGFPIDETRLVPRPVDADVHRVVIASTPVRGVLALQDAQRLANGRKAQRIAQRLDLPADPVVGR